MFQDFSPDEYAQLAWLGLILSAIAAYFAVVGRGRLNALLKQAGVWAVIFLAAFLVAGMWTDIRNSLTPRQSVAVDGSSITLPRSLDGHYYMSLQINGVETRFIVDTGATDMVLSREAAQAVGIDLDGLIYSGQAFTANGLVRTASIRLDTVKVGTHVVRNVRAVINEGPMPESLLGMSFLERFNRIEITGNQMVLER